MAEKTVKIPTKAEDTLDYRSQRKQDAQSRQGQQEKTRPLKKELEQIDKRMPQLAAERAQLEEKLAKPGLSGSDIAEAGKQLKAVNSTVEQLEERWLELSEQIEALQQEAGVAA